MNETIVIACFTVGGTLLGVVLTLFVQYLMERWKLQKDKEREVLILKMAMSQQTVDK